MKCVDCFGGIFLGTSNCPAFWKMEGSELRDLDPSSIQRRGSAHCLPSELLSETFLHLSNEGALQLRHALFVCRFWYNVIIHNPNLWSTIKIDQEFFVQFPPERSALAEAFIHLCLERSSPIPLHITLNKIIDPNGTRGAAMERMALVCRMLGAGNPVHIRRCVAFSWVMMDPDLETTSLGKVFPKELEMLQSLYIKDFLLDEVEPISCFPKCTSLKEVHLVNHTESHDLPYFPDDDFARVEKLVFANKTAWMNYDIPCISRFRSIRILVLHDLSAADDKPSYYISALIQDDEDSVALLPSLQRLELVGLILRRFLCRFDVPSLQEVLVEEDISGRHSLADIPSGILQPVTSIVVTSPSSSTSSWSQELRKVTNITNAPSLKTLTLPSRIDKALGKKGWYIELTCRLQLCIT